MAKIVLVSENIKDDTAEIISSLDIMGHYVAVVSPGSLESMQEDDFVLIILIAASYDYAAEAARIIRRRAMLNYKPIIVIGSHSLSGKTSGELVEFMRQNNIDNIINCCPANLSAYRINRYVDMIETCRDINPLTGLPGNKLVNQTIENRILGTHGGNAVVYSDINDFKAYNDAYGFHAGDAVINFTAGVLKDVLREHSGDAFLGHIGGDDFVLVLPKNDIDCVVKNVIADFESGMKDMYQPNDYERKGIVSVDREGRRRKFDLMSLSLVSFTNERNSFTSINEISEYTGILKHMAKKESKAQKKCFHLKAEEAGIKKKVFSLFSIVQDIKIPLLYRKAVIEAMGETYEKQHEDTLLNFLDMELPYQLKKSCLYALGKLRSRKAVQKLIVFAEDSNPHLRSRAVEALANIGAVEAVPVLMKALKDKNIFTRRIAALSLGRLGDKRTINELVKALDSEDTELKKNVIISLGELCAEETAEIISRFINSGEIVLKKEAIRALGHMYNAGVISRLLDIFRQECTEIRETIAGALYEIISKNKPEDTDKYTSELIAVSRDDNPMVRGRCMDIMGLMEAENAKNRLKEGVNDKSSYVRWHAAAGLARKKSREVVFIIKKQLKDKSEQVRITAARSLGIIGSPYALEALRISLKDSSYRVSQEAAEAIIRILKTAEY